MFGEVISTYSRKQAIEDGVLINVTARAGSSGFKISTCITSSVWADISEGRDEASAMARLDDVLWMAGVAARSAGSSNTMTFQVKLGNRVHTYRLTVGPGDRMEPVVTIMQTHED